eukprot:360504-Chlamydomonas_euryale.AAC.2
MILMWTDDNSRPTDSAIFHNPERLLPAPSSAHRRARSLALRACTATHGPTLTTRARQIAQFFTILNLCTVLCTQEGKKSGFKSLRGHTWTDVDNSRCGGLPFVFDANFGFERYVDYAMDVPMYFVYRDGTYVDALGMSWHDFMNGEAEARAP